MLKGFALELACGATFGRITMRTSKVVRLIYNHNDDLDGWQLLDGTLIHFPPHVGAQLAEWINLGDEVFLEGESRVNRNGVEVVFPTYIESQGWSLSFDQKRPPPPRGSQAPPPPPEHEALRVSNEDIMRELLKLRRLIENRLGK
jgi:hypothetical protein